jgi:hypothetical protein
MPPNHGKSLASLPHPHTHHLLTHSSQSSDDPKTRRRGKLAQGEARTLLGRGLCQREELLITRCIPRRTSGSVPRSLCCVCGGGGGRGGEAGSERRDSCAKDERGLRKGCAKGCERVAQSMWHSSLARGSSAHAFMWLESCAKHAH